MESQAAFYRQRFGIRENDLHSGLIERLSGYGLFLDIPHYPGKAGWNQRGKPWPSFLKSGWPTLAAPQLVRRRGRPNQKRCGLICRITLFWGGPKTILQLNNFVGEQHEFIPCDVLAVVKRSSHFRICAFDLNFCRSADLFQFQQDGRRFWYPADYIDMLFIKVAWDVKSCRWNFLFHNRRDYNWMLEALKVWIIKDI